MRIALASLALLAFLALPALLIAGCSQALGGFRDDDGDGVNDLDANRGDAGPTGEDAGPDDEEPPPPPPPPPPPGQDAGPADGGDDEEPPGPACVTWQDCAPWFGDPMSGFACVDEQCQCDPAGNLSAGCATAGGFWNASTCYCEQLDDESPASCTVWQDCPPHYGSEQSGFECVSEQCTCDPGGQYQGNCASLGGYWVGQECFCTFADVAPPNDQPEPDCWWHWVEPVCDPDRWVDTSHYEQQCSYNAQDEYVCENVWVTSGYYEDGACPAGHWEQRCYG